MPKDQLSVAYLANVYPAPSHTFIRREISAVESTGWRVHRFSHRRSGDTLVEPADQEELNRTEVLLGSSRLTVLRAVVLCFIQSPSNAIRALVTSLRMATRGHRLRHVGYFAIACRLARRMRELGCRHVHAHFGTNSAAVACLARIVGGFSYSITYHGFYEFESSGQFEKLRDAEFVVTVSSAGAKLLRERYPEFACKVALVRCGLDEQWARHPSELLGESSLVCIARLDPHKNPLLLIEAAALLQQQGVKFRLTIAGDGMLRSKVEEHIQKLGLEQSVTLAGWCSQDQIAAMLARSRALVLSSREEGLPIAIMEAFAAGRPAIATNVGGVKELVQPGVTGWLVPSGDVNALAKAMQQCLASPTAELRHMGENARNLIKSYDIRRSAAALVWRFEAAIAG